MMASKQISNKQSLTLYCILAHTVTNSSETHKNCALCEVNL